MNRWGEFFGGRWQALRQRFQPGQATSAARQAQAQQAAAPAASAPPAPGGLLLGMTTATTALLAVLFGLTLYALTALNERQQAEEAGRSPYADSSEEQDRYLNLRLLTALRTFETGIVAGGGAGSAEEAAKTDLQALAQQLQAGVPACRSRWARQPNWLARQWARWRSRAGTLEQTEGQQLAAQVQLLQKYLNGLAAPGNQRMTQAPRLDLARWLAQVEHDLQTPVPLAEDMGHGNGKTGKESGLSLQCSDISLALDTLLRHNGRLLAQLDWRDSTGSSEVRRWAEGQQLAVPPRVIAQFNPWRGVAGCVYFRNPANPQQRYYLSDARNSNREVCEHPDVAGHLPGPDGQSGTRLIALRGDHGKPDGSGKGDENLIRWGSPPSLAAMLMPLDTLRQPFGSLYRAYTEPLPETDSNQGGRNQQGPNRARIGGAMTDVGFSLDVSIDPQVQTLAQQVAACYTGQQAACKALNVVRKSDAGKDIGHTLLESALVRMAGIAIIDIPSGRIDALAGALSPCTRQEHDGPGRDMGCDNRLPWRPRYRPDALLNPAVFQDVMPASTVKPIMAAAFLSDGADGSSLLAHEQQARHTPGPPQAGLRHELMHSDSAAFLRRMFCVPGMKDCERPWRVQAMATRLGWNAACQPGSAFCGKRDLLSGRVLDPLTDRSRFATVFPVVYGRLLTAPEAQHNVQSLSGGAILPFGLMPNVMFSGEIINRCAAGADGRMGTKDDWEKCRGGNVVDGVAEGWGQGHARTTPVGVAGMMAMIGAAANGAQQVPPPHLVEQVRGLHHLKRWDQPVPLNVPLAVEAAGVILDGLSWSHRGGTAASACKEILGQEACAKIDWLAGKTGTPTFRNDDWSLDRIAPWCREHPEQSSLNPLTGQMEKRGQEGVPDCSSLRPYKWYTAVYRLPQPDTTGTTAPLQWHKAIAVLTERNWQKENGKVHGAGDRGPNPAAEIALQIMLRQRRLASPAPAP